MTDFVVVLFNRVGINISGLKTFGCAALAQPDNLLVRMESQTAVDQRQQLIPQNVFVLFEV